MNWQTDPNFKAFLADSGGRYIFNPEKFPHLLAIWSREVVTQSDIRRWFTGLRTIRVHRFLSRLEEGDDEFLALADGSISRAPRREDLVEQLTTV